MIWSVSEAPLIPQQLSATGINRFPQIRRRTEGPFDSGECSKCRTSAYDPIPISIFDVQSEGNFLCSLVSITSFSQLCKPRAIISCLSEFEF